MTPDYDLDTAYDINGPADAKKLYDDWASTYDASFADGWGYVAPREIARIMLAEGGDPTPILDVGAGTGRVAEHLEGRVVDGFDISSEMLAEAKKKGLYRNLITGDLTQPLDLPDGAYGGVISSGTFTHGHVGPGCFPELLRITRPGALFCCGAIAPVLDGMGFGSTLAMLVAEGRISPVRFKVIDIYEGADHPHAKDRGLVMVFERL
ncbi:MAG: class I SAM-dependent methyltransferase [Pseudomonadota bacterium]